jgi:excisionase family DNA binding protein
VRDSISCSAGEALREEIQQLQLSQIISRVRPLARPTRRSQGATPSRFRFIPHAGVPPVVEGSPAVDDLLEVISKRLAAGKGVSVWVADDESEVTPREAAEMLGVSRQFVMRLISDGDLESRRLPGSSHRRVPVEAVVGLMRGREAAHTRHDEATRALDAAGVDYE